MGAMRIWLAVAAILAQTVPVLAETLPLFADSGTAEERQCAASTEAMCEQPTPRHESNTYFLSGGTCYALCTGTCVGEGSALMTTVCYSHGARNLMYLFWFLLLIFLCYAIRLVWKLLSCIFCCGTKGSDMH